MCRTYVSGTAYRDDLLPDELRGTVVDTPEKAAKAVRVRLWSCLGCVFQLRRAQEGGDTSAIAEYDFLSNVWTRSQKGDSLADFTILNAGAVRACLDTHAPDGAHDVLLHIRYNKANHIRSSDAEMDAQTSILCNAVTQTATSLACLAMFALLHDPDDSSRYAKNGWRPYVQQWRHASMRRSLDALDKAME